MRNEAALQRFDARLLKSMKALQQDGWWEELVNAGGSPVPIMQLGSSRPKVEVGSWGVDILCRPLYVSSLCRVSWLGLPCARASNAVLLR